MTRNRMTFGSTTASHTLDAGDCVTSIATWLS